MLHGHIQSGECHVIFQHWDLPCLLGLGHLKRGSEFYVMGSWMECLWSLITILRYLLYWSLPTDSTDCVHHWLTTVNHISCLWVSSRNRLPIPLMVCTSTSAYSLNVFCVNTPLLKSCLFGPAIIHFLHAKGFLVSSTAPPEPFTRSLFCCSLSYHSLHICYSVKVLQ